MKRRWNWPLWAGFLLSIFALVSFFAIFVNFPATRDLPWANLLLFAVALALLFVGLRRAFTQPAVYRGRIFGPILATLSVAILGLFCYGTFVMARELPVAKGSPQVGQKAPEFTLPDTNGKAVSLAQLLSEPLPGSGAAPKGVLLVFYRGYW
jgi:hypothetical protein